MKHSVEPDELRAIVKKTEGLELDGRSELILTAMVDLASEMHEIKRTIDDIVRNIEGKLPEEQKDNDQKFEALIRDELKDWSGKRLEDFVCNASGVVRSLEGRPLDVLQTMFFKSKGLL